MIYLTFFSLFSITTSNPVWEVVGNRITLNGDVVNGLQGVSLSCTEFDSSFDRNKDGSYVCPYIHNGTATTHLQELATDWKAQIIRIPINSQWYMWDIDTGFPRAPDGCQFASIFAGNSSYYGPWKPSSYRKWIDDHVTAITKLGMIAMLDLHWSDLEGTACCDNGRNGCFAGCQQTMADRKSLKFWEYVAKKYQNRSDVWFEAYNEPTYSCYGGKGKGGTSIELLVKGGESETHSNGCPPSPLTKFTFVGMQDIYDTIRLTGADNIVVVGGVEWSWSWYGVLVPPQPAAPGMEWCTNELCQKGCKIDPGLDLMLTESSRGEGYPAPVSWSKRRWAKNVVYATHPYQSKGGERPSPGTPCSEWISGAINGTGQVCSEGQGWYRAFGMLRPYVPVIATEFGPGGGFSCDGAFVDCQMQYFKSNGISYTPWAYWGNSGAACSTYPTLVNPDWTPNGYGQAVKDFFNS